MYQPNEAKAFTMKNAEIFMRNFTGRAGKYTPEGTRTFMLRLPNDVAEELADDGWNVSYLRPREEGDLPTPALNVTVFFNDSATTEIYTVVGHTKTLLTEDTVSILDNADIVKVDLRVRPRVWGDSNKGGIKAYLEKMYVTVQEDDLDSDYNFDDLPFSD